MKLKIQEILSNPKNQYVFLALITLLAAVLRFYKLGEWSFWIDEIFTIDRAQAHFSSLEKIINNIPPVRNWIPISVILNASILNLLGVSEWSARLVPAVIGILSFPILYFPTKKIFGVKVALIALLLLAVSPWHIYWSQNARFYTSLMLLYSLGLFAFFLGLERDRPVYILIFFFLLYLALSERLISLFIVPVVVLYLLLLWVLPFEKPLGFNFRNIILIIFPGTIIGLLEIFGWTNFSANFDWFFLNRIISDPLRMLSFISFDVGVALMCFASFVGIYLIVKKNRAGLLIFINAVVPVILLLVLNPFLFTLSRYVFITLPSWVILGAIGIREIFYETRSQGKILALGLLFVFLVDSASSDLLYYQVNNGNRLNWKMAYSIVKERMKEEDELVTWWPHWEGFYWDKKIIVWEDLEPEFIVSSGKRFWFVFDNETIWGNTTMKNWMENNAELIDILYLRREDDAHLKIYLYDPARNIHTNGASAKSVLYKDMHMPFKGR